MLTKTEIIFIIMVFIGTCSSFYTVDKPREPISLSSAIISTIISILFIIGFIFNI